MPVLNFPIQHDGAIIEVGVGVSIPRARALQTAGHPVPSVAVARALLDTGASCSAIDPEIVQQLGIVPSGTIHIHTPSTTLGTPHVCNQFDIALVLAMDENQYHVPALVIPVIETALKHQGIQVLIGRDVLNMGVLHYDGLQHSASLAF